MLFYKRAIQCAFQLLLLIPFVGLLGCGETPIEKPADLAMVTGMVTYKGKPLPGASVAFVPKGQTAGTGAYGVTDASGRYQLTHRTDSLGVEPGSYVVAISKMALPDGSPIPEGQDAADVGAVQTIPPIYSDPSNELNPNQVTVAPAGGEINLNLK